MTRLWPRGEAVEVWGGEEALAGFAWQGTRHHIEDVWNQWRIHTHWWGPPPFGGEAIWREYLKVTTDTGLLCLLYRDLLAGGWFLARVYD
jgi:hypothetical protein